MIGALSGSGGYAAYAYSSPSKLPKGDGQEQPSNAQTKPSAPPGQLTDEQQRVVDKLKQREAEVRAHEQAHKMAGGSYAGSPSYTTTQGPDGRRYITGGEVSIDIGSVEGDPEATIRKMEQIKRAALAPSDPSSQDRAVAMQAEAIKARAEGEKNDQRQSQLEEEGGVGTKGGIPSENGLATSPGSGSYNRASRAYRAASSVISGLQGVGVIA
ncbi:MAG: hypothetical protein EPN26_01740 [Rhodospirillales bacterium]|nr:MAG: hypothetical protein EPN26_01740 [Rhodospirillales bacterium]